MTDAPGTTRQGRRTLAWRVGLLVAAVLYVVLVALWNWDWFKGPVERRITAATGRAFKIGGHLDVDVDVGRVIVVRATDLSLQNAPWSATAQMARADLLRLEIPFWPLVRGDRMLRRVDVVRPSLLLERNARGDANWRFRRASSPKSGPGRGWSFGELRVHDGRLDVHDAPFGTNLQLTVDSALPQANAESVRMLFHGSGRYRSQPFKLDGWADSPVALLERADAAWRVDVSARAGATRARAYGALRVPLNPAHVIVNAELRGDDLADLYPLLGLAIPSSPPYLFSGHLERKNRVVAMHDMKGRIGDSDIDGDASVDLGGAKPMLTADLASNNLDLDDLGGLIGLPPGTAPGESVSPAQREEALRRAASPRLLPDKDYDLHKLNAMNADVRLRATHIDAGKWPFESIAARLQLRDALVQVDPLVFGFAGGKLAGKVTLDARKSTIDAGADVGIRSLDLERMFPKLEPPNIGRINGTVRLHGHGNSIAAMMATADGEAQLGMGRGRFSNLLLELAGLDVYESLKFLLGKDHTVKLRCAYGDFGVEDGHMKTRSMAFDTSDTVVFGSGSVDFGDEALDLEIRPQPKDFSPVSLRGPIEIAGTIKHPKFYPKPKPLMARIAAAAALYAVAPPAALLALIETGPGENVDCHGLTPATGKGPERTEADQTRGDDKHRRDENAGERSKSGATDHITSDKDGGNDASKNNETPEPKPPKAPDKAAGNG